MNNSKTLFSVIIVILLFFMSIFLFGCGKDRRSAKGDNDTSLYGNSQTGILELEYAKEFAARFYEGGLTEINIGEDRFLIVDEGCKVPDEAVSDEKEGKIKILRKPLNNIYVASSAVMDYFDALDALDSVSMTSTKAEDWSIDRVKQLVTDDVISYVGKYSMPDYEYVLDDGCSLAIENRMIYHSPETKEKLETLGIPVMVDWSSLEESPLARVEWIKLYGILTGREEKALEIFESQKNKLNSIVNKIEEERKERPAQNVTAVLFYINASGIPSIRNPKDYFTDLIRMAGADYSFDDIGENTDKTYINIQMEEFYSGGYDTDVMIYNSNFGTEPETMEDITSQDEMLKEFKAVKNGNVWCYSQDSYQQPTKLSELTEELYEIFKFVRDGGEEPELEYFKRISK